MATKAALNKPRPTFYFINGGCPKCGYWIRKLGPNGERICDGCGHVGTAKEFPETRNRELRMAVR